MLFKVEGTNYEIKSMDSGNTLTSGELHGIEKPSMVHVFGNPLNPSNKTSGVLFSENNKTLTSFKITKLKNSTNQVV